MSKERAGQQQQPQRESQGSSLDKIVRLDPGTHKQFYIASSYAVIVDTHFHQGRTIPCIRDEMPCPVDHRKTSLRSQMWLAVQPGETPKVEYLALTPAAYEHLLPRFQKCENCRGWSIMVSRSASSNRGRMFCQVNSDGATPARLTREFDLVKFLARLWTPALQESVRLANDGEQFIPQVVENAVGQVLYRGITPAVARRDGE